MLQKIYHQHEWVMFHIKSKVVSKFCRVDPYVQRQKNLYSLLSGYHAHKDIEKDLMNAEVIGKPQEGFVNYQIKTKKVPFYYQIKKNKLKIFSRNISSFLQNRKDTR